MDDGRWTMTTPDELSEFVKAALARGVARAEIDTVLRQAGWTIDQTRTALAGYADTAFPIPVPRPRPYLDARDAFMYLVLFSTLYWSTFHLGSLLFDIINVMFPDPATDQAQAGRYAAVRAQRDALVDFVARRRVSRLSVHVAVDRPRHRSRSE